MDIFVSKVINFNMLGVKSTAFVYSEALLKVEQEDPVFLVVIGLLTVFVDVDFVKSLELARDQFTLYFEKLVLK